MIRAKRKKLKQAKEDGQRSGETHRDRREERNADCYTHAEEKIREEERERERDEKIHMFIGGEKEDSRPRSRVCCQLHVHSFEHLLAAAVARARSVVRFFFCGHAYVVCLVHNNVRTVRCGLHERADRLKEEHAVLEHHRAGNSPTCIIEHADSAGRASCSRTGQNMGYLINNTTQGQRQTWQEAMEVLMPINSSMLSVALAPPLDDDV